MIQNLLQKILAKLFGFDKVIADIDARVEALPKDIDVRLERIEQTQLRKSKFTTDHPELLQLTPGEDGVSCKGIAIAGAGSTQVQYSVTDLNDPSDVQSDTLEVEIVAGKTASIQADFTVFDQDAAQQAPGQ